MIFETLFWPIDNLSLFMVCLIAVLFPCVLLFSLRYVRRNFFRYYFVLFITLLGMVGTVLSRDLLSFYVCLEVMTVGIYFLIIDNAKKESFPAGFKYVIMMFAGGLFILVAALMLYNLTGTFEFNAIARLVKTLPVESVSLIITLFTIGFIVEIGAVPFHVWLPDAHPIAPSPVSALLSGLAIKVGAYGLIRVFFILGAIMPGLMFVGIVSMLFGVVLAFKQTNVKRLLAYSSISQMGYVVLGIGLGTSAGLGAGLFHLLNHATFKILLFLCMGSVIYATKKRDLKDLGGLRHLMPVTMLSFIVGALAISGIPPMNGFASKALLSSAVGGNLWLKVIMILTAAGTLAVLLKLFREVFLGALPRNLKNTKEVPFVMQLALLILAAICLVIGLWPGLVLAKFINPVVGQTLSFKFWSLKALIESLGIIFLGLGLYFFGAKVGLLQVIENTQEKQAILSLNRGYCFIATSVELLCNKLKMIMRHSLNAYLFWVFLTLVALLFLGIVKF